MEVRVEQPYKEGPAKDLVSGWTEQSNMSIQGVRALRWVMNLNAPCRRSQRSEDIEEMHIYDITIINHRQNSSSNKSLFSIRRKARLIFWNRNPAYEYYSDWLERKVQIVMSNRRGLFPLMRIDPVMREFCFHLSVVRASSSTRRYYGTIRLPSFPVSAADVNAAARGGKRLLSLVCGHGWVDGWVRVRRHDTFTKKRNKWTGIYRQRETRRTAWRKGRFGFLPSFNKDISPMVFSCTSVSFFTFIFILRQKRIHRHNT